MIILGDLQTLEIRMKKFLFFTLVGILLSVSTAVGQDVRYNFDKNADFSKFKTYKWVPLKDATKVNDLVDKQIIDSVNAIHPEPMAIDRSWDVPANPLNRFCRSDQVNYVNHDVPVTYFSLGYAQDYHQPTDEPRYADYEHAAKVGRFIHDIMLAIANRKDRPAIVGPDPSYPQCR